MKGLIAIILIGSIVAFFMLRRGETLRFETLSTPSQVIMAAISNLGTHRRWSTVTQGDHNVAFGYRKRPSILLTIILLFFFLLPGIVYLVLGGKHESVNVMISDGPGSHSTVQVTSNGFRGKSAGRSLHKVLTIPATEPAAAGI